MDAQGKFNSLAPIVRQMELFTGIILALATVAPQKKAEAFVRIHSVAKISEDEWRESPHRTEKLIRDEQGGELLLRLIEFQ